MVSIGNARWWLTEMRDESPAPIRNTLDQTGFSPKWLLRFGMAGSPGPFPNKAFLALTASEQRDKAFKEIIEKERAETDAKTARLKALRLARDAEQPVEPKSKPKTKPKR